MKNVENSLDAVKDVVNKSKNLVDTEGRKSQGDVFVGGFKVKAISGSDSSKLKIKTPLSPAPFLLLENQIYDKLLSGLVLSFSKLSG